MRHEKHHSLSLYEVITCCFKKVMSVSEIKPKKGSICFQNGLEQARPAATIQFLIQLMQIQRQLNRQKMLKKYQD